MQHIIKAIWLLLSMVVMIFKISLKPMYSSNHHTDRMLPYCFRNKSTCLPVYYFFLVTPTVIQTHSLQNMRTFLFNVSVKVNGKSNMVEVVVRYIWRKRITLEVNKTFFPFLFCTCLFVYQ